MRTRSLVATVSLLVLCTALPAAARAQRPAVTVIAGTLLGADGAPMKLADVHLYPPYRPHQMARVAVDRDGRFAIATASRGLFHLMFTGVGHASAKFPLLVEGPATIAVDVRLPRYAYTDTLEQVAAVGDWNNFSSATARPLVRQPDGRYTLEMEAAADTVAYQLIGFDAAGSSGRGIDGPQAEWFVRADRLGYRAVIRTRNGRATIALDPARLDRRPSTLSIVFRDPTSPAGRFYALSEEWNRQRTEYLDASRLAHQRGDSLRFDWTPIVARRTAVLARERDPMRRQLLLLQLLDAAQFDAAIGRPVAQQIIREVPPSSPLWTDPGRTPWMIEVAFTAAAGKTGDQTDTAASRASLGYLDRVVAEQPDSMVQTMALYGAMGIARRSLNDMTLRSQYISRLLTEHPYSSLAALVRARSAPNRVWREGAQAPAFRVTALDDTAVTYAPETFAGKVYLLEFWATWCGPCIRDMPYLHAAHDSLAAQGLEIVSISLDNTPADVRRFRAGEWRMPWRHAYVPGGLDDAQMRRLEIAYLPRVILVGRDGRIVAVDEEGLHGDSLMGTLRRALAAAPSP